MPLVVPSEAELTCTGRHQQDTPVAEVCPIKEIANATSRQDIINFQEGDSEDDEYLSDNTNIGGAFEVHGFYPIGYVDDGRYKRIVVASFKGDITDGTSTNHDIVFHISFIQVSEHRNSLWTSMIEYLLPTDEALTNYMGVAGFQPWIKIKDMSKITFYPKFAHARVRESWRKVYNALKALEDGGRWRWPKTGFEWVVEDAPAVDDPEPLPVARR